MILNSHISGDGPPLVFLHGLFGSWENWGSQIRKLEPDYQVIGLDLRNHGESGHSDDITYDLMAGDVLQTLSHLKIKEYHLLGHSMGGKVAMVLAGHFNGQQYDIEIPQLDKLIIVDIAPRRYQPQHEQILTAMQNLDLGTVTSRAQADRELQHAIPELAVRQFILKNLQRSDTQHFEWRLNLAALARGYHNLLSMPALEIERDIERDIERHANPVLVLRGSESDYVNETDQILLATHFPNLLLTTIEGAGHWPHVSHAADVHRAIADFLSS